MRPKLMEVPQKRIDAFMAKVRRVGDGCWIRGASGGTPWSYRNKEYAPAIGAWIIRYGRKPKGTLVSSCGTKYCCNPAHHTDRVATKGRAKRYTQPESHHRRHAQLTAEDYILNRHLRIPACPRCGAPPFHFECLVCGSPR